MVFFYSVANEHKDGPDFIVYHSSTFVPLDLAFFYTDVLKPLTDGPSERLRIIVYLTAEIAFGNPKPPLPHVPVRLMYHQISDRRVATTF